MKRIILFISVLSIAANSCSMRNRTKSGAVIGAGAGAAAGAAIGKAANNNTLLGAIIGAAVGGATGAAIGRYMDKQAEEIKEDVAGAKVERVGEGIKITFDSGILFDVNSSSLKKTASDNISKLAKVLKKYEDTEILIEGHTDSSGDEKYNQELSVKRAKSVEALIAEHGIKSGRFTTVGYGETQPIDNNESVEGKANNRRVDIAIMANKKLKKAAKRGDI